TYCNSQYQDVFAVTITDADGNETKLFEQTVDALCGSVGPAGAEIPQSGDPDGTFTTGWLPAQVDVSAFAGKKDVTLRFSAGDVADSIYAPAVLRDNVRLDP